MLRPSSYSIPSYDPQTLLTTLYMLIVNSDESKFPLILFTPGHITTFSFLNWAGSLSQLLRIKECLFHCSVSLMSISNVLPCDRPSSHRCLFRTASLEPAIMSSYILRG